VRAADREYFKAMSSRITNYEQNVKAGNLMVIDFAPFYDAALRHDLTPYKKVGQELERMRGKKKDMEVRYVGDATGRLFGNKHFDECFMIESWWQDIRMQTVTTLCLFPKSLMGTSPFDREKGRIVQTHNVILDSHVLAYNTGQEPITARKLKEDLAKLESLVGRAVTDVLVDEMKRRGIDLSSNKSYFLKEIHGVFDVLFGQDAAKLIMERREKGFSDKDL
jgi:hypothetical protein